MKVSTFEVAMMAFLGFLVLVLVSSQSFLDHSNSGPATEAALQSTIERSLDDPGHGDYSPEVVAYATGKLQMIYNQAAVGSSVDATGMLEYLTYLAEGSVQDPTEIDYCTRVLPLLTASHKASLQAVWVSEAERDLAGRINQVADHKGDHGECQPVRQPAQPV